jgi:hypothetical protein
MAREERDAGVLAAIAGAFGHLGDPHGLEQLLELASHADGGVRDAVASALAGRPDPRAVAALVQLSADPEPAVRDWATFALGALSSEDTEALREALAARLSDADSATRLEAVHGLALRGDPRAVEAALDLLGGDGDAVSVWERHALEEATIRLAAASGDARFRPFLPADTDRFRGTTLERELDRALERTAQAEKV